MAAITNIFFILVITAALNLYRCQPHLAADTFFTLTKLSIDNLHQIVYDVYFDIGLKKNGLCFRQDSVKRRASWTKNNEFQALLIYCNYFFVTTVI